MKPNRIVINFDNQESAPARRDAGRQRSSRSGVGRVLAIIAVLLILIVGGIAGGGYLWWRHYQASPAYSLALLVDATQRNDRQAIDNILDTDKIATDFISQIRARVPASAIWAPQVDLTKMTSSSKVKETLRDQLVKEVQRLTDIAADKPLVLIALAVPRFADIKQENNQAHATVNLKDEQIQLTMVQNGDRWRIIAVQDERLAKMLAQAMINTLPANGGHLQDELERQLNNLPNLGH
jgi:uncharacterized membrane protein